MTNQYTISVIYIYVLNTNYILTLVSCFQSLPDTNTLSRFKDRAMEFACGQCEYQTKTKGELKIHHNSLHMDIKYTSNL